MAWVHWDFPGICLLAVSYTHLFLRTSYGTDSKGTLGTAGGSDNKVTYLKFDVSQIDLTPVSYTHLSCISISSKCKEPEMAVKLLEKLHTDEKFYTLIRQGVSGIHYELKDGEVSHENIPEENLFSYWTGCVDFTLEQPEYMEDRQWEQEYQKIQERTEELRCV